jgi:integrase
MKKHLTDLGIERMKAPKAGQEEVFDLGYPGLALRVGNGGAKSFVLFFRREGKLKRVTLGRWPRISLAAARESWRAIQEGRPLEQEQSAGELFSAAVEEWLRRDQSKNKASSVYQVTRALEHDVLPAWRGKRVDEITKRHVIELLDGITDRGAATKANRVFAYLRNFFGWCIKRDLLKASPMEGLDKPGKEVSRDRVLSDEELSRIWTHAAGGAELNGFGAITRLLILTGARREEIGQLRWSEIEGDTIHLANGRTKTGSAHIIPLSAAARELLASLPRYGEFVFGGDKPIAGWSRAKARLDEACGVADWRIHDLRRTVATGLQKLGVSLQTVEAVLGHTSGSRGGIVGVYQRHDYADEKRAALEAWGAHVCNIVK